MDELIRKLEQATGPDRALDAEIDALINKRMTHRALPAGYTMEDLGDPHRNTQMAKSDYITSARGPSPHYTRSIDDAATLVPEGMIWEVRYDQVLRKAVARVGVPTMKGNFSSTLGQWVEINITPALALSIAALKARTPTP